MGGGSSVIPAQSAMGGTKQLKILIYVKFLSMLIDWITLRLPLESGHLSSVLHDRIMDNLGSMVCCSADGEVKWIKKTPDWESIRSDSAGLYWSITYDGDSHPYLTIGASPASLLNDGVNVFGSLDLQVGCETLLKVASKALGLVLPNWWYWHCTRLDITANYDMGNPAQVKQALRLLLATDAPRRKASSDTKGGDSVYWNGNSPLRAGKAYHKGAHLRYMAKKGKISISDDRLQLADRLLRLEMKLGARWFRSLSFDWHSLTAAQLTDYHFDYFSALIGSDMGVYDMETLLQKLEQVSPTMGQALAAHRTWALIKTIGYDQVRHSIPHRTFMRHQALLKLAGLTAADLCSGNVIPFRQKTLLLDAPVLCWDDIKKAA